MIHYTADIFHLLWFTHSVSLLKFWYIPLTKSRTLFSTHQGLISVQPASIYMYQNLPHMTQKHQSLSIRYNKTNFHPTPHHQTNHLYTFSTTYIYLFLCKFLKNTTSRKKMLLLTTPPKTDMARYSQLTIYYLTKTHYLESMPLHYFIRSYHQYAQPLLTHLLSTTYLHQQLTVSPLANPNNETHYFLTSNPLYTKFLPSKSQLLTTSPSFTRSRISPTHLCHHQTRQNRLSIHSTRYQPTYAQKLST